MPSDVATESPGYKKARQKWDLPMVLMGGTSAIRANADRWLPKFPGEDFDEWEIRIRNTTLTNVFKKTVGRLSSTPFAKPIGFDPDVDDRIGGVDGVGGWAQNVDRSGTDVSTFARDLLIDLLVFGKCHIYIDYPQLLANLGNLTLGDMERQDIRPYLRRISPKDLFSWTVSVRSGSEVIDELRWHETATEKVGQFEEREFKQIRVVRPTEVEVWRKAEGAAGPSGNKWIMVDQYPVMMPVAEGTQVIPFETIYANKVEPMVSDPPLEDLADLNLKHVNIDSDLQRILHVNCIPFMLAAGFNAKELEDVTIAPNTIVRSTNPNATLNFVEHSGASIVLIQNNLAAVQDDMERMSLEMVSKSGSGDITATEKAINTAEQTSELQEIVRNMESGLDRVFQFMLMWAGEQDPKEAVIGTDISSDFGLVFRSESDLQLLIQMFMADGITHETFLQEAKCRGLLNEALNIEEEVRDLKKKAEAAAPPVVAGPAFGGPKAVDDDGVDDDEEVA
jgi:hypothetical protein